MKYIYGDRPIHLSVEDIEQLDREDASDSMMVENITTIDRERIKQRKANLRRLKQGYREFQLTDGQVVFVEHYDARRGVANISWKKSRRKNAVLHRASVPISSLRPYARVI